MCSSFCVELSSWCACYLRMIRPLITYLYHMLLLGAPLSRFFEEVLYKSLKWIKWKGSDYTFRQESRVLIKIEASLSLRPFAMPQCTPTLSLWLLMVRTHILVSIREYTCWQLNLAKVFSIGQCMLNFYTASMRNKLCYMYGVWRVFIIGYLTIHNWA